MRPSNETRRRRDYRVRAVLLAVLGTAAIGYVVSMMPSRGVDTSIKTVSKRPGLNELPDESADVARSTPEAVPKGAAAQAGKPRDPQAEQVDGVLKSAETQIRAKKYDDAIAALHAAREQLQKNAKAYLLMARALEGKSDYDIARDFYAAAIDRDVLLADAYFGFATASESLGDLESAIGGMRNYLHVQPKADMARLKIAQARSAIWEWESRLGRGAWGESKGIPPGFTEAELKRDGRGVGIKMPIPSTRQPDGTMKYEIKHQDKFQIFKP